MRRLVSGLLAIFVLASVAVFLFGDAGVASLDSLAGYRNLLAANVADLQARNDALRARLELVRSDPATLTVMARSQGLFVPGEHVVKLEGAPARTESVAIGALVRRAPEAGSRSPLIKTIAVAVALAAAAALLLRSRLRGRPQAHAGRAR